jgi:hypothetical protein
LEKSIVSFKLRLEDHHFYNSDTYADIEHAAADNEVKVIAVVSLAYASSNQGTVMVKLLHTSIAHLAVASSWRSVNIASLAIFSA